MARFANQTNSSASSQPVFALPYETPTNSLTDPLTWQIGKWMWTLGAFRLDIRDRLFALAIHMRPKPSTPPIPKNLGQIRPANPTL